MAGGNLEGTAPEVSDGTGAESRIGTVVDKYTIVRLLGKGGMGAVYEARHAKLARRFAIKFLLPEFAANREILRRFENEAKAAGGLEHANLAAVTDVGRAEDGAPYLVMEFLEGEDCSALLRRLGTLPVARAANIVLQACRGLAVVHKAGICHRDLKPENLYLADAGDGTDLVKVLDFGIAKLREPDGSFVTRTGATFGTAAYMSPEQARGAGEVDQRADVWSLGVVLYEFLTGRKPFPGQAFLDVIYAILHSDPVPLANARPGLPPALVAVVERAMTKDVGSRTPTVTALAEALGPFASRQSSARVPSVAPAEPIAPTLATGGLGGRMGGATFAPKTPLRKTVAKGIVGAALVAAAVALAFVLLRGSTRHLVPDGGSAAIVVPTVTEPHPPAVEKTTSPPIALEPQAPNPSRSDPRGKVQKQGFGRPPRPTSSNAARPAPHDTRPAVRADPYEEP